MDIRDDVVALIGKMKEVRSQDLVQRFGISRQYASQLIRDLMREGHLIKVGTTRGAYYVPPGLAPAIEWKIHRRLRNKDLKEHEVLESIEKRSQFVRSLPENIRSIFEYSFSEMLNNAIEHSGSPTIAVEVEKTGSDLLFHVDDVGIGAFRNVMQKRQLSSELEAMQDLLKGKTTTQPQAHSGEGIFFTSKAADVFVLEGFGYRMVVDNRINDVFFEAHRKSKRGTHITFRIATDSPKHLSDIFRAYQTDPDDPAFDKTEIRVKLYTMGTIHVSRSQARRVLSGLEKFRTIILDFDQVPGVGQAFADEVFRVFKNRHPEIQIKPTNMQEAVRFMIERVGK